MQHLSLSLRARRTGGRRAPRTPAALVGALIALAVVLSLLGTPGSASAGAATGQVGHRASGSAKASDDPLQIHLASVSPSTLSDDDQPLTITGRLTNGSDEQWTAIKLYSFRSTAPILDAATLADSAFTEDDAVVGERIITPGTEATVDVLEPGQSADFILTVPRSEIAVAAPGVYWLGVQALGTSSVARDLFADGRARTFIPLVPGTKGNNPDTVEAAIVLPVRETVWTTPDGRVDRVGRWARSLDVDGRLTTILDAGSAVSDVPVTWLVDPAVLAAVARLAVGNPARSIVPDPAAIPTEPTEDPAAELDPQGGAAGAPDPYAVLVAPIPPVDPERVPTEEEARLATLAQAWLDRFKAIVSGQNVLALPFGDLDVSAAATHGPVYYQQSVVRSAQVMAYLEIVATPALAPRDGILSRAALEAATAESTILLADTSFAVPPDAPESMVRLLGHKVVVTSSGAASGGPSPTAADDPLALRQRILSEAALRLQSGSPSPVVMMLPAGWKPSDPSTLLNGLDVPWLDPVSVADVSLRPAVAMNGSSLAYTEEDVASELDIFNFTTADLLTSRGDQLADVLSLPNLVRPQVADEVLMSLSGGHRVATSKAADSARAANGFLAGQLSKITVDAPQAVTLSSESGNFGAEVINGLDQPITVEIALQSDGSLEMEKLEPIPISAGARHRILPKVTATRPGIHQVRLVVTDAQGLPLGDSAGMQIRAAQVSGLIWLLLAGGALLLFGTIAVRLVRRIRGRSTSDSEPAA